MNTYMPQFTENSPVTFIFNIHGNLMGPIPMVSQHKVIKCFVHKQGIFRKCERGPSVHL